jgi:hypothetical protein
VRASEHIESRDSLKRKENKEKTLEETTGEKD